MHEQIRAFISTAAAHSIWMPNVVAFLNRQASIEFIETVVKDSGKSVADAVFVYLAAIRYLNADAGSRFDQATILDNSDWHTNLDLFLVQNHNQLLQLCRTRTNQVNIPQRAFPLLDLLAIEYGSQPLHIIELGASLGLIGQYLLEYGRYETEFAKLFGMQQQKPLGKPKCLSYTGIDRFSPDPAWTLACIPDPAERSRLQNFLHLAHIPEHWRLVQADAADFAKLLETAPTKNAREETSIPIILSSYMLYQNSATVQGNLIKTIQDFCATHNGHWINLEPRWNDEVNDYYYTIELDQRARVRLSSDRCESWELLE